MHVFVIRSSRNVISQTEQVAPVLFCVCCTNDLNLADNSRVSRGIIILLRRSAFYTDIGASLIFCNRSALTEHLLVKSFPIVFH